jgi:hypothetical protein
MIDSCVSLGSITTLIFVVKHGELIFRAVGSVVALIGAYVGALKYLEEKRKANKTARTESQKPFSTKQQEIYFDLVTTTAMIGNRRRKDPDRIKAEKHFWVLFWGPLPMVANEEVANAIDDFSVAMDTPEDGIRLRNTSMNLARACRHELGEAWNRPLEPLQKPTQANPRNTGEDLVDCWKALRYSGSDRRYLERLGFAFAG